MDNPVPNDPLGPAKRGLRPCVAHQPQLRGRLCGRGAPERLAYSAGSGSIPHLANLRRCWQRCLELVGQMFGYKIQKHEKTTAWWSVWWSRVEREPGKWGLRA